jgi:hypothetical protein
MLIPRSSETHPLLLERYKGAREGNLNLYHLATERILWLGLRPWSRCLFLVRPSAAQSGAKYYFLRVCSAVYNRLFPY